MSIEAMKRWLTALQIAENIHLVGSAYTVKAVRQGFHKIRDAAVELDQAIKEAENYPPECQTEAEKTAYAFGWWKALESVRAEQAQPFGYFKAEPCGWTDCAETDDGAVALYTTPPQRKPEQADDEIADVATPPLHGRGWPQVCVPYSIDHVMGGDLERAPSDSLTDEEIADIAHDCANDNNPWCDIAFARAIEAKLKEKNT